MTKKILLSAAAVSVMALAGTASAHDLVFRPGPVVGAIDAAEVGATGYRLAEEAISTASGAFALDINLSPTSTFPSGNNIISIDLNGGTFATALSSANVSAPGCTVVLSSGGAAGSTNANFLVSSSGGSCSSAQLDIPVTPGAASDVWLRSTLRTEAGSPIDPDTAQTQPAGNPFGALAQNQEALQLVDRVNAFAVVIDGAIGAGALTDTFATLTQSPVYTEFFVGTNGHDGVIETDDEGQLGTIRITVDTTARRDLALNFVTAADVTDADVVVTGNFTAFNGASGAVDLGAVAATVNTAATTATINNQQAALTAGAVPFTVNADGGAIPSSAYSATVSYTLNPTFYASEGPVSGALETIGRDGTNVVFPWMNSSSIQTVTGTSNVVRLGNISTAATGPVFVQVLNAVNSGSSYTPATAPVQIAPSIAANGELVISTAALTAAVGEFGRGDLQISVEAPPSTITARRYATLANGSVTEFESGTVANDQNQTNVP
jgi:hypothetical protein